MPFELRIEVGPGNHVFDKVQIPPLEGPILRREKGIPLYSIGTLSGHLCKNGRLDGGPDPPMRRGNFGGKGRPL